MNALTVHIGETDTHTKSAQKLIDFNYLDHLNFRTLELTSVHSNDKQNRTKSIRLTPSNIRV